MVYKPTYNQGAPHCYLVTSCFFFVWGDASTILQFIDQGNACSSPLAAPPAPGDGGLVPGGAGHGYNGAFVTTTISWEMGVS